MSVATDHVAFFITERAGRYPDSVTITDLTSRGTFNRSTKQYDTPTTSTVYSGDALIRPATDTVAARGGEGEVLYTHLVYVPPTVTGIGPGNTVTVVTAPYDSDLSGAVLTVQAVGADTLATHRVLKCLLSQGGGDNG